MRVVVTGTAADVGSHVADRLAAERHEPVALDALIPQAPAARGLRGWGVAARRRPRRRRAGRGAARDRRRVPPGRDDGLQRERTRRPGYAAHNDLGTAVLNTAGPGLGRSIARGLMAAQGGGVSLADHGAGCCTEITLAVTTRSARAPAAPLPDRLIATTPRRRNTTNARTPGVSATTVRPSVVASHRSVAAPPPRPPCR